MGESILNDKRILAVDDEPDILDTLDDLLEDYSGLVLDKAKDYETGYHLIRSWTYDAVILDIMGVRGFDYDFLYPIRLRWGKHAEGGCGGKLRFPPSSKLVFIPL